MSIASNAFQEMYKALSAPTKCELVWDSMTRSERSTILRHADVGVTSNRLPWNCFTPIQKHNITESIKKASSWAVKLGVFV